MMKKFFTYIALAITTFSLSACYFEDKQLFDESAAQRLDSASAEVKELLESASNGWLFEYYLGAEYGNGSTNFLVKFKDGHVEVSGDITEDNTWVERSTYRIARDQGIVISFDSYNEIFHSLCEPDPQQVDGLEGDFEFIVLKTEKDKIEVKGKKWGNHMTLTRLPEDKSWEEVLDGISNIIDNIFYTFKDEYAGKPVTLELDDYNHVYIAFDEESEDAEEVYEPFIFTNEGFKTRTPFQFNGKTFQHFTYDAAALRLTSTENPDFSLKAVLPEGYKTFSQLDEILNGTFTFSWYNGLFSKNVTISTNVEGNGWIMSGLNAKYDIKITYNKVTGFPHIYVQMLGTDSTGDTVALAAWDLANGGNLTWSTNASVRLVANEAGTAFTFADGRTYPNLAPDSFILWAVNAKAQCSDSSFYPPSGSAQMPYLTALTKKQ